VHRAEILAVAVHQAWCTISQVLGETPVPWDQIPSWRRSALEHTVGFWESWSDYRDLDQPSFLAATHVTWMQYHRRNNWAYSDLTPYVDLQPEQKRKLRAMLDAYVLFRGFFTA